MIDLLARKAPATIKGIFVNSHVTALKKKKGAAAVSELRARFGRKVNFGALEAVPIRDEITILEHALDLMSDSPLKGPERALCAGRLHFTNFSNTTLGSTLMRSMPHTPENFITLMHNAPTVARTVFSNTTFRCQEEGDCVIMTIDNCDYPAEHFQGFFEEWMRFWALRDCEVWTRMASPGVYEYRLTFKRSSP